MKQSSLQRYNFYGRKHGKKLSKLQKHYITEFLPAIAPIGVSYAENPNREKISFSNIFGADCPVWIEVGFGGGEHLLSIAEKNTDIGFIGCEPYRNGVAKLLPKLFLAKLTNVRILMDDARILFDVIPAGSVSKIFILFPDPWPKQRHSARRFINPESIRNMRRILKRNGLLYVATDAMLYVRHVLENVFKEEGFEWSAEHPEDWRKPWPGWQQTRYCKKAILDGKKITYLVFRRI